MEEQPKSKIVWVLFVVIVALGGLNIYQYYIANNLEKEVVTEVAVVETSVAPAATVSTTPTTTATTTNNENSNPTLDEVCGDIYYHHYVAEEKKVGDMVCYFDNNNQTINSNYALFQVHECSQLDSKTGNVLEAVGKLELQKLMVSGFY